MQVIYSFMNLLERQQPLPVGKGAFGSVFAVECKSVEHNWKESRFAVKEVFFDNDYDSEQGYSDQQMLVNEVLTAEYLKRVDPGSLYFAQFFGVFDVTEAFKRMSLVKENDRLQN